MAGGVRAGGEMRDIARLVVRGQLGGVLSLEPTACHDVDQKVAVLHRLGVNRNALSLQRVRPADRRVARTTAGHDRPLSGVAYRRWVFDVLFFAFVCLVAGAVVLWVIMHGWLFERHGIIAIKLCEMCAGLAAEHLSYSGTCAR